MLQKVTFCNNLYEVQRFMPTTIMDVKLYTSFFLVSLDKTTS